MKKIKDDNTTSKLKDMKYINDEDVLQKKRYLNSTLLDQSFHVKQVFNIWHKLHSEYQFEGIQKKLAKNKSQQQLPPKAGMSQIGNNGYKAPDVEYYKGMKYEFKLFRKWKDQKISDLNDKYLHPCKDMNNYCFTQKRPLLFGAEVLIGMDENTPIKKYCRKGGVIPDPEQKEAEPKEVPAEPPELVLVEGTQETI